MEQDQTQKVDAALPAVSSTELLDAWEKAKNEHVALCFKDAPKTEGGFEQLLIVITRESFDAGFRAAVKTIGI